MKLYGAFEEGDRVKILPNESFGFQRVTVERPHLDDGGNVVTNTKGTPKPDTARRDQENVPLPVGTPEWQPSDDRASGRIGRLADADHVGRVEEYLTDEIRPWVPGAWVDHAKTKIGYEVPVTRHFYAFELPRPIAEIDAELKDLEARVQKFLAEVIG